MDEDVYSLQEILAVAKIHPFYNPDRKHPPDNRAVQDAKEQATEGSTGLINLEHFPLLWKSQLYTVIQRLLSDTSADNTYRRSVYASTTGGGSSQTPLFFATDVDENRKQRKSFGLFLRRIGIVTPGDWVVTIHTSGKLYRSLDLMSEILENAGASVLSAGHHMPANEVAELLINYNVNVLSGDSSQVTQIAYHISTLPRAIRDQIRLEKIIYTSEMLTPVQRAYIHQVLGPIKICSIMASAETGPWTASNPDLTGDSSGTESADFIYDTRAMQIEIFPSSCLETDLHASDPLPDGEQGYVAATSLSRLRHPLVRYITGDIASVHLLPDDARAKLSEDMWRHLRVLRLRGRDRRLSFDWDGEYIEFSNLKTLLEDDEFAILQWQVILGRVEPSQESSLEVRILCASDGESWPAHQEILADKVKTFFNVDESNAYRFQLKFVASMDGFERSSTGRKVIKFIDRFN